MREQGGQALTHSEYQVFSAPEKSTVSQKSSVGMAFTCISWAVKLTEDNNALEWVLRHPSRQCA